MVSASMVKNSTYAEPELNNFSFYKEFINAML